MILSLRPVTLLDQGARYEVTKFRSPGVREEIEAKWNDISAAMMDVLDFVRGRTFIQCDKALPSYNVLIPLIYFRFHDRAKWQAASGLDNYLLRSSLAGAFSGTPDQLIDDIVKDMRVLKVSSTLTRSSVSFGRRAEALS